MVSKNNPSPPTMKDTIGHPDSWNGGFAVTDAMAGQKVVRAFALDRSSEAGTAQDERNTMRGMGGGKNNLSHSLNGVTANMTGKPRS